MLFPKRTFLFLLSFGLLSCNLRRDLDFPWSGDLVVKQPFRLNRIERGIYPYFYDISSTKHVKVDYSNFWETLSFTGLVPSEPGRTLDFNMKKIAARSPRAMTANVTALASETGQIVDMTINRELRKIHETEIESSESCYLSMIEKTITQFIAALNPVSSAYAQDISDITHPLNPLNPLSPFNQDNEGSSHRMGTRRILVRITYYEEERTISFQDPKTHEELAYFHSTSAPKQVQVKLKDLTDCQ